VLVTGLPAVESAVQAVEYGAFRYILKPIDAEMLRDTVDRAAQLHRLARMKRQALDLLGVGAGAADRAGLEASFERAMQGLWIAFQPIVRASDRSVFGYEALLRSGEPSLPGPGHVLEAAERLGELVRLGRAVRHRAAESIGTATRGANLFLNLHPQDLADPELYDPTSPLVGIADRVILEITERASVSSIEDVRARVGRLRELGFRIAVDDLGAGYAGLTSFALLEPELVKLDMTLVRDIDSSPVKQKLVASMTTLCRDMGLLIVAEGIETAAERDTLLELGCDLFQGYLFARPGRAFPEARWDIILPEVAAVRPMPREQLIVHEPNQNGAADLVAPVQRVPLAVLDSLGDGVVLVNAERRIVFSNKAAERILGVGASDADPETWAEHYGVFLPDGAAKFPVNEYPLMRALSGEATDDVEMLIRNPELPDAVLIFVTGRPLRDPNQQIVGASVVFRDVTALRKAERELLRANEELRAYRSA
ncbi:MAG TPA: EAL domain-containing protein, partial [Polyangiaceae bacterium]|nr:EAL domain-containing protein [Polyangiaceae bacterium]